jgi:glycosyltransferase involved in cell wall biosynthesis
VSSAVNIVLPVYNGALYLHEAIQSVLCQSVKNWHLYLVDDGSTDGSLEVLAAYTGPQVTLSHNENNMGLYGSLLQAIRGMPPGWVVIVMQDDRLKPHYLESMLDLADSQPDCQAFWAAIDTIDENGRSIARGLETCRVEVIEPGLQSWLSGLRRGCFWTISGSFTSRDMFLQLPFATQYPHCGDYDWLLRALRYDRLVYYERSLTEIRLHAQQASARHLHIGKDVEESFAIIRDSLGRHGNQLGPRAIWWCCQPRVFQTLRRSLVAFIRGRPRYASCLLRFSARFALLPFLKISSVTVS